jgi:GxxExxY protein
MSPLVDEDLTHSVIGAFFEVYNTLGFGFLEQVYVKSLERELTRRGHAVQREVAVDVFYKGERVAIHRMDMIVDKRLVVETKATPAPSRAAPRQLYNYLRATNLQAGLLLHFGPEPKFFRLIHESLLIVRASEAPAGTQAHP